MIGWGKPNRAVPRVTISDVSTRSSTGTRIGDGEGGAVRAATSAGDLIVNPATQLPAAVTATTTRTRAIVEMRFLLIAVDFHTILSELVQQLV